MFSTFFLTKLERIVEIIKSVRMKWIFKRIYNPLNPGTSTWNSVGGENENDGRYNLNLDTVEPRYPRVQTNVNHTG